MTAPCLFLVMLSVVCVCNASLLDAQTPADNHDQQENTLNVQELGRDLRKKGSSDAATPTGPSGRSTRLPGSLRPYHYNLVVRPHIYDRSKKPTFDGQVEIFIQCVVNTRFIILNTRYIRVTNSTLHIRRLQRSRDQKAADKHAVYRVEEELELMRVEHWEDVEQLVLHVDRELEAGSNYSVKMRFHGVLVSKQVARGLYWSSYTRDDGTESLLAATHFSPVDARRAFPCFDEPYFKATYNISVWRKPPLRSLSNMHLSYTETGSNGWVLDHYHMTPPMPTYTVGFVVCDFPYRETITSQGYQVRVWSQPAGLPYTDFVLESVEKLIDYFENYTGIAYNMRKLDLISIPAHAVAAMENWGMITFRESSLWHDPEDAVSMHLVETANTLAHEISHMWFGNLVTPTWWNELWLKEGFATYFMYQALQYAYPDWEAETLLVGRSLHPVMRLDGTTDAKPVVNNDVTRPRDLMTVFSHQAYAKGACLLRQLKSVLTEDVFHECIKRFILDNQYGAVDRFMLWEKCNKVAAEHGILDLDGAPLDVSDIMEPWMLQSGYPLVSLSLTNNDDGGTVIEARQKQFFDKHFLQARPEADNDVWNIPLTFVTGDERDGENATYPRQMLRASETHLHINEFHQDRFLMNIQQTGYYRVHYGNLWQSVAHQLLRNHKAMHVINRAQIIDDAFQLASIGEMSIKEALDTTPYLSKEIHWLPWTTFISHIHSVLMLFQNNQDYPLFKEYLVSRFVPLYVHLGWNAGDSNESVLNKMLRYEALWLTCELGYEPCIQHAHSLFLKWLDDPKQHRLHPDIRNTVLCSGVRRSGRKEWEKVRQLISHGDTGQYERADLINCLACSNDLHLLERYLKMVLREDILSEMEAITAISSLISNKAGKAIVWQELRNNWKTFPLSFAKGSVILTLAATYTTRTELHELVEFKEAEQDFFYDAIFDVALSLVQSNVQGREAQENLIQQWLQENAQFHQHSSGDHNDPGISFAVSAARSVSSISTSTIISTIVLALLSGLLPPTD